MSSSYGVLSVYFLLKCQQCVPAVRDIPASSNVSLRLKATIQWESVDSVVLCKMEPLCVANTLFALPFDVRPIFLHFWQFEERNRSMNNYIREPMASLPNFCIALLKTSLGFFPTSPFLRHLSSRPLPDTYLICWEMRQVVVDILTKKNAL